MKITHKDLIDNSFCLSVSTKRQSDFIRIFNSTFGACPRIFRGFRDDRGGVYSCSLGYSAIIRMAKSIGMPYVGIFEDDAYPRVDCIAAIDNVMNVIPIDAKMVFLGYNKYFGKLDNKSDMSIMTSDLYGTHSYVVFSNCYDEYLDLYDKNPTRASDWYPYNGIGQCYISNINIFIQRCVEKSMNGWSGYILDNKSLEKPPEGFAEIL